MKLVLCRLNAMVIPIRSWLQLNLYLTNSQVRDLVSLASLTKLTELTLQLLDSKVTDLTPLTKLDSCQTLVLKLDTNQRMSLKTIPPSVTHLEL